MTIEIGYRNLVKEWVRKASFSLGIYDVFSMDGINSYMGNLLLNYIAFCSDVVARLSYVRFVLKSVKDINASEKYVDAALMVAAYHNKPEMVKLLVRLGVDIDTNERYGEPALIVAANHHNPKMVKLLVELGANVDVIESKHGTTALMLYAFYNNPEMVKFLMDAGANVNLVDKGGYTALDVSREKGHSKIIEMLNDNHEKNNSILYEIAAEPRSVDDYKENLEDMNKHLDALDEVSEFFAELRWEAYYM